MERITEFDGQKCGCPGSFADFGNIVSMKAKDASDKKSPFSAMIKSRKHRNKVYTIRISPICHTEGRYWEFFASVETYAKRFRFSTTFNTRGEVIDACLWDIPRKFC